MPHTVTEIFTPSQLLQAQGLYRAEETQYPKGTLSNLRQWPFGDFELLTI